MEDVIIASEIPEDRLLNWFDTFMNLSELLATEDFDLSPIIPHDLSSGYEDSGHPVRDPSTNTYFLSPHSVQVLWSL